MKNLKNMQWFNEPDVWRVQDEALVMRRMEWLNKK